MNAVHVGEAQGSLSRWCFFAGFAVLFAYGDSYGQSVVQTLRLQAGWNAVYVEVDPEPAVLDALLEGTAISSVWVRDETRRTIAGTDCAEADDANCLTSTDTGWRVWFSPDQPQSAIRSLKYLRGGRTYMVEAAEPTTWTLRGKPSSSVTRWQRGFNLGGFHVVDRPDATPTFQQYLSASLAHQDAEVYEVNSDGSLSRVASTKETRITPGRGYWVESSANTVYDGPVRIDARSLRGVDLSAETSERFIQIENVADTAGAVTVSDVMASGSDSSSDQATSAVSKKVL